MRGNVLPARPTRRHRSTVQYFAAVEPQRRLAPHIHIAIRDTVSRAELRRLLAATYHQVWWPGTTTVRFDGAERLVWDEQTCTYVDPVRTR